VEAHLVGKTIALTPPHLQSNHQWLVLLTASQDVDARQVLNAALLGLV